MNDPLEMDLLVVDPSLEDPLEVALLVLKTLVEDTLEVDPMTEDTSCAESFRLSNFLRMFQIIVESSAEPGWGCVCLKN